MRPWTLVRRGFPLAVVTAVAVTALVTVPDPVPAVVSAEPTPAEVTETVVPPVEADPAQPTDQPTQEPAEEPGDGTVPQGEDDGTGRPAAELTASTSTFSLLGVTWDPGSTDEDPTVEVRWRSLADGWSDWTTLETAPGDPISTDVRPGTDPLWVGESDAVDVRVSTPSGRAPSGVRVSTVTDGDDGGAIVPTAATVGQPAIISRSAWGAKSGSSCSSPVYGASMLGTTLHHTAGSNTYTKAQSAGIVRATQAYHTGSQGWCDIGYNFLVDKYGQIFEGRKGGITKMVRGAHAGVNAANERTIGVSLMGNYDVAPVPAAMKTAVADLVAWRHSLAGLKATGTYSLGGKTVNRIMGHRDVKGTACPGRYGYAWLTQAGGLRSEVAKRLAAPATPTPTPTPTPQPSAIQKLAASLGSKTLGAVVREEYGTAAHRRAVWKNVDILWTKQYGAYAITGPVKKEFYRVGGHTGVLGYPRSAQSTGTTPVQRFIGGSVYLVTLEGVQKPFAIYGPLWDAYVELVQSGTSLGVPTSSITSPRAGIETISFTKGTLQLDTATGKVTRAAAAGASADRATVPASGSLTLRGHGFGHGIGMSQYGAEGAARAGETFRTILTTYYPGVRIESGNTTIRVLLSSTTSSTVQVRPRTGLVFRRPGVAGSTTLPTSVSGAKPTQWRITPVLADKKRSVLQYYAGSWKTYKSTTWVGAGEFAVVGGQVDLVLPNGKVAPYRNAIRSTPPTAGATTRKVVNVLSLDAYVLGVIAAEMPSSWSLEALKAQAVSARTYARRSLTPSRYYDVCDTTACQVYRGVAAETSRTNTAGTSTRGLIMTYKGAPAFTQYSSSNGGWSAPGTQPYLAAKADRWDGWSGNKNHDWTVGITAAALKKAFPTVGTPRSLEVLARDGAGEWGGRVTSIKVVGSTRSVTVSGPEFRFALGLKSAYFRLG